MSRQSKARRSTSSCTVTALTYLAVAEGSLDAVGIVVSDLKRAVEFYRMLGVPFEPGMEESEHGHAEAELDGGMRLMLDTEAGLLEFDPNWERGTGASGATLAF